MPGSKAATVYGNRGGGWDHQVRAHGGRVDDRVPPSSLIPRSQWPTCTACHHRVPYVLPWATWDPAEHLCRACCVRLAKFNDDAGDWCHEGVLGAFTAEQRARYETRPTTRKEAA